jgi:hypothetical protein
MQNFAGFQVVPYHQLLHLDHLAEALGPQYEILLLDYLMQQL